MGSRNPTHKPRGRSWRPSAEVASFGLGPREVCDFGALDSLGSIPRSPPGFDPMNRPEAAPPP
jgi:hypothetical protein